MDIEKVKQQTIADFIDKVIWTGKTESMSPGDAALAAIEPLRSKHAS